MNTASTASNNVRETAKDARDGLREVKKAANEASGDIQSDLQALRDDFARLAEQVTEILSDKGSAAWKRARSSVDDVMAGAQDKGREAAGAVRDVSDNFVEAIDESIASRPYTTLAIVAALGFLFGATWRALIDHGVDNWLALDREPNVQKLDARRGALGSIAKPGSPRHLLPGFALSRWPPSPHSRFCVSPATTGWRCRWVAFMPDSSWPAFLCWLPSSA